MTENQSFKSWIRKTLWCSSAYFWVCGLTAAFCPQSWLLVAGLPSPLSNELSLAFAVAGTFMMALGFGAAIASINPQKNLGLILTLAASNLIDLLVTFRAVTLGQLPLVRGVLFILVAASWAAALGACVFAVGRSATK